MKRKNGMVTAWTAAIVAIALECLVAQVAQAKAPQRRVGTRSNPGKPVSLSVSLIQGGVEVEAYDGKDVVVEARPSEEESGESLIVSSVRDAVAAVVGRR